MPTLFDPLRCGAIDMPNRVVMAPLTRNRAPMQKPTALMATYYAQRASAGLIVSEAAQICAEGQGYLDTPGLHRADQLEAWKQVTSAVHAAGGRIVAQLWHVGRISHVSLQPGGQAPVSSTARAAETQTFTANGFEPVSTPRALREDELPGIVAAYAQAARAARDAGFDGVEIHGANGYLIDQFLRDTVNDRADGWGGAIAARIRLAVDVMRAVADAIGADRTGIRLSPIAQVNGAAPDRDPQALYAALIAALAAMKPAFIHVIEGMTGGPRDTQPFDYAALRHLYRGVHPEGVWIVNNGYTRQMALDAVAEGRADAVAFGRSFISNPDLVERLRRDAPLQKAHSATFYGGGAEGYTDYPTLEAAG